MSTQKRDSNGRFASKSDKKSNAVPKNPDCDHATKAWVKAMMRKYHETHEHNIVDRDSEWGVYAIIGITILAIMVMFSTPVCIGIALQPSGSPFAASADPMVYAWIFGIAAVIATATLLITLDFTFRRRVAWHGNLFCDGPALRTLLSKWTPPKKDEDGCGEE